MQNNLNKHLKIFCQPLAAQIGCIAK